MNFNMNMAIGGLLGTVFVLMSVSIASEGLFHSENPEKPGFEIAAAEATDTSSEAAAPVQVPIADLMAKADPVKGEALFKKCVSCHTNDKGGGNKIGPNLYGVVGRPIAHLTDFSYSKPMQEFSQGGKEVWSFEHLNEFLLAPKKYIKGTAMGFAGDKKDSDRADIIAYLNLHSDAQLPMPTK